VSLAISRGPIPRSHVQGRSPSRLWVVLPSGGEGHRPFGPWIVKVLVERPRAVRAGEVASSVVSEPRKRGPLR
jgi:hypothetical protein